MKLVIDIPEEDYEYLKLYNKDGLYNAILNGKPLSSVIDAIKAEINYVGAHSDYGMQCVFAVAVAIIDKHLERIRNE